MDHLHPPLVAEDLDTLRRGMRWASNETVEKRTQGAASKIYDHIKQKIEEGIVLPGGWIGDPSGHAMLYKFKQEKDKIIFSKERNKFARILTFHFFMG